MLTEKKRDELLIRLDERVDKIRSDQKELKKAMESDKGFTRCQIHAQDIQEIQDKLKWYQRTAIGAVLVAIVNTLWDYVPMLRP
jgi:hypothetical protein